MKAKFRLWLPLLLVVVLISGCTLFSGEPGKAKVSLKMVDGTPITEAEVRLLSGTKEVAKGSVNTEGIVELPAKAGSYKLEVTVQVIGDPIQIEESIAIERDKTTTKSVTVENVGVLTLTFKDKHNYETDGGNVTLKDSNKKVLSEKSGVKQEAVYVLKTGAYYIDVQKDGGVVENYEVTVNAGANAVTIPLPVATIVNVASGQPYRLYKPFEPQYADSGGELTDGQVGTTDYKHEAWVGTLGSQEPPIEGKLWQILVVDLGEKNEISEARLICLRNVDPGIQTPQALTVAVSNDGVEWEVFDRQEYAQPDDLTVHTLRYTLEAEARFVAFYIEQVTNWLFLGEVEVDGILGGGQPAEGDLDEIDLLAIFNLP